MALAKPKKKKIIIIIIILTQRAQAMYDLDIENSASEALADMLTCAKEKLYAFPDDEGSYSTAQSDAWEAFEAIETAVSPEAMTEATEGDIETLMANFETAIANC